MFAIDQAYTSIQLLKGNRRKSIVDMSSYLPVFIELVIRKLYFGSISRYGPLPSNLYIYLHLITYIVEGDVEVVEGDAS